MLSHPFFDSKHPVQSLKAIDTTTILRPKVDVVGKENRGPENIQGQPSTKNTTATFEIEYLSTERLAPIHQTTKHGRIEILPSHNILVDFKMDQCVILINTEKQTLGLFKRQKNNGSPIVYEKRTPDFTTKISCCPSVIRKTVRYAAKFVDLVRSKTPKVINLPRRQMLN